MATLVELRQGTESEAPSGHTGWSWDRGRGQRRQVDILGGAGTGDGVRGAKWPYWVELRQGMGSEAPSGHSGSSLDTGTGIRAAKSSSHTGWT